MNAVENAIAALFGKTVSISEKIFYPSKKNQVTRLQLAGHRGPAEVVAKYFVWGDAAREEAILIQCREKGLNVPEPLYRKDNVVLLEYIPGSIVSYPDMKNPLVRDRMAQWLAGLHGVFVKEGVTLLKQDMRLHNFILSSGEIWGVDFEESSRGPQEEDLADLCASILEGHQRGFEKNLPLARKFLQSYKTHRGTKLTDIEAFMAQNLRRRAAYGLALRDCYLQWAEKFERREILL